jgi:hypothetical protein
MIIAPEKSGEQNSAYRHRKRRALSEQKAPFHFLSEIDRIYGIIWIGRELLQLSCGKSC